jgi:hypothetical protein
MNINKDLELFFKQHSWEINKLKGGDVFYYIEDNFKHSLPSYVSWHIENQELAGIKNAYDQGWYDCLKMIERYFSGEV